MSKALRKAIMVRSKLKNKYQKNRTGEIETAVKKKGTLRGNLLRVV